ncbi:MAG: class I SAM-dependent methyltransferase [Fuerstiella sp.]|nr:class I SAM-dependent methyltransferase [Fuerstiella sp.]
MDPSHLTQLVELEDNYWWHVAKRKLIIRLLSRFAPAPGQLVEGGIGSGRNLVEFSQLGYDVTGFDLMSESVDHVRQRGIEDVRVHDLEDPWPVDSGSLNAVVLLDVLEHVQNPVRVLDHAYDSLTANGSVFITVPSYPWLFSRWDEQLGHFRRYTIREFRRQARESGFRVQWLNHWNSFTLPAALAVRGWEKMFPQRTQPDFPKVSGFTNRMLLTAAAAERCCMDIPGVPAGLSLVGVLRK